MKLDPYLTPFVKFNSKLVKDLRAITIKPLEGSIGINLHDLRFGRKWILRYNTNNMSNNNKKSVFKCGVKGYTSGLVTKWKRKFCSISSSSECAKMPRKGS